MRALLPPGWPRPKGYANAIEAKGRLIFTAGLVGWDKEERFATGFGGQFRQILENLLDIFEEAGANAGHIARMTWYVTDRDQYVAALPEIGAAYRELIGKHYPAMAVVEVSRLVEPEALIEIEVTAVVPE